MRSAKSTVVMNRSLLLSLILFSFSQLCLAQENSPYSRYGMGDLLPAQHIANRALGGISSAYGDFTSINFSNPASFANISSTLFDLGIEVSTRTLKSNLSTEKFKSVNTNISYLQLGLPLSGKKMIKKGNSLGLVFGLKPLTRINYKILSASRLSGIDSIQTLYEGSGGLNQVSLGAGYKIKRFSFGAAIGYNFGTKDYSTRLSLINDTVIYYKSNSGFNCEFHGLSFTGGFQWDIPTGKTGALRLGMNGTWHQALKATGNRINETFTYSGTGEAVSIDTVSFAAAQKGTVVLPSEIAGGISWADKHWLLGAEFQRTKWSDYRFYGQADAVQDIWKIRAGIQYYPASENTSGSKYFQFVKYRAGFYYGPDYIKVSNNRNEYAFTAGAAFPMTAFNLLRRGEFVMLHTGIELGSRGNKTGDSIRENFFRCSFGISMTAKWFQKPKYD